MKEIGGYFELELRKGSHYHSDAMKLNTARNCFEYVIRARMFRKVYIPFYTCDVMLEPIQKLNIKYEFYSFDQQLNPVFSKKLQPDEAFLYINYFGLKQKTVEELAVKIGKNLIVDNSQAFFTKPIKGMDTFYSARKFFGVPDGAYLYTDAILDEELKRDYSYNRITHLTKRIDCSAEEGFLDFRRNDDDLINNPIRKMSGLTESLLSSIDYEKVKEIRRKNYTVLADILDKQNRMHFALEKDVVPMVYPYLTDNELLKDRLISNKIYIATYWPNVLKWCKKEQLEYELAEKICPLPIDQRYNFDDMSKIVSVINQI